MPSERDDPDVTHLWCTGCHSQPTVALFDGGEHLVCHCTHVDGGVDPVQLHGFDSLPGRWDFHGHDDALPEDAGDAPRTRRVFGGEITSGLTRWYRREQRGPDGDPLVMIERQQRMHHFGRGYRDSGPALALCERLSVRDARAVRDLLDDWLAEVADGE